MTDFVKLARHATNKASEWFELPHVEKDQSLFLGMFPTPADEHVDKALILTTTSKALVIDDINEKRKYKHDNVVKVMIMVFD